jgi:hypothetical protein
MNKAYLSIAAALLAAACAKAPVTEEPARLVLTQRVMPGGVANRDIYSGEVRARYETDVGFRIAGKIVSRPVDAGARVTKGQILARLDPDDAKLAAQGAQAMLASAESEFALARSELDRHTDLLNKKFISQSAFDVKQNAFNAAKAKVEQARTQARITGNQASYANLVADADGVVISVAAEGRFRGQCWRSTRESRREAPLLPSAARKCGILRRRLPRGAAARRAPIPPRRPVRARRDEEARPTQLDDRHGSGGNAQASGAAAIRRNGGRARSCRQVEVPSRSASLMSGVRSPVAWYPATCGDRRRTAARGPTGLHR